MSVDVTRIKKLYEEFGSLERAVQAKRQELEKINQELRQSEARLRDQEREYLKLKGEAEKFRQEIYLVENLRGRGFTPEGLEAIAKLAEGMNPDDILKGLEKYRRMEELESQLLLKEGELRKLEKKIEEGEGRKAKLEGEVEGLKRQEQALLQSIGVLKESYEKLKGMEDRLRKIVEELECRRDDLKREIDDMGRVKEREGRALKALEEQTKRVRDELNQRISERMKLEEDIESLTRTRSDLEREIEQRRYEIESSKAIVTLLSSSRIEDLKSFRGWVDGLINAVICSGAPSAKDIDAARSLIIERLMGTIKILAYRCNRCNTRWIIETGENIVELKYLDTYYILCYCPVCRLSSFLRLDAERMRELFPTANRLTSKDQEILKQGDRSSSA